MDEGEHFLIAAPAVFLDTEGLEGARRRSARLIQRRDETIALFDFCPKGWISRAGFLGHGFSSPAKRLLLLDCRLTTAPILINQRDPGPPGSRTHRDHLGLSLLRR